MMKQQKKISAILALAILASAAASCGAETPGNTTLSLPETNSAQQTELVTETEALPTVDLPEMDFGGRTFTILTSSWGSYSPLDYVDIAADTEMGEALNDAAYQRCLVMGEKYNCKVVQENATDNGSEKTKLGNAVKAGDAAYDVAMIRGTSATAVITGQYLYEVSDFPYLDFSQPWWSKDAMEALKIKGKLYTLIGDATTNHLNAVWTVCFNKKLINDYDMDDPYTLVKNGTWTFDRAMEMSKTIARDLDGDDDMGGEDLWGINFTRDTVIGFLNASGVDVAKQDASGNVVLTINEPKNIERTQSILVKLFDESYAMDTFRPKMKCNDFDGKYFAQDTVLFLCTATHLVWQLRQMDVDFGMIPYPKYAESEDYRSTTAGIFMSFTGIPSSVTDTESVGYFLEAYTYEGWRLVRPAFYDNILKGKLARDNESAETLDYLYGNLTYDIGNIFNFGSIVSQIDSMSDSRNTDIVSFMAEKLNTVQSKLDTFLEEIGKEG